MSSEAKNEKLKELKMKKISVIMISLIFGAWMFGTEKSIDNYYNSLDEDYSILAAHTKTKKYGTELMRKRAYKRKRMRRLPNNGK